MKEGRTVTRVIDLNACHGRSNEKGPADGSEAIGLDRLRQESARPGGPDIRWRASHLRTDHGSRGRTTPLPGASPSPGRVRCAPRKFPELPHERS